MIQRFARHIAIVVLLAAVATAVAALRPRAGALRTEDRNFDGRPDVWRTYDADGRLTAVSIDTNFDGRSDVHEYYVESVLVRRESDRNFDDRVDLVEGFDRGSVEPVRTIVDIDYDGVADLLVLRQAGQPVLSKLRTTHPRSLAAPSGASQAASRSSDDALGPLIDPFQAETALHGATGLPAGDSADVFVWGGPSWLASPRGYGVTAGAYHASTHTDDLLVDIPPTSPRGPPPPRV